MSDPFVSVFLVPRHGPAGLKTCLDSLERQDYPRDRFEVLVVESGATKGATRSLRGDFPAVRVIRRRRPLGFGDSVRAAVPSSRGELLAFLGDGSRAGPAWLSGLVTAAEREGVAAAASTILDWEGTRVDFAGAALSLLGHAWPLGRQRPPERLEPHDGPVLFGSAAGLLIERGAYAAAGGFDPDYFACGEDVDLGWRMSILGLTTVLSPESIVYRRSDPDGPSARAGRLRLEERNALFTIYKCFADDMLHRVLAVAVPLTLARALHRSGVRPEPFVPGPASPSGTTLSRESTATLVALQEFARRLGALAEKRNAVQARRRVADDSLLPLFLEPLRTHPLGPDYEAFASELYDEFGLSRWGSDARTEEPSPLLSRARGDDSDLVSPAPPAVSPTVSVIVPTVLGPTHLSECLSSLRALRYRREALEVIVVDDASPVDPTPSVSRHYPEAKVVRLDENRGFCGAITAGARAARGRWLALLNDDTRVDPGWLDEMLATAKRRGAPCVAARILDWRGERIDFAGGAVNFEAKGFQLGHGSRDLSAWSEERPTLFACGAAMLVRRDLFLETGGFDESWFAYYEDVAFGWELHLRGHDVWLSPNALVYHRHQGSAGRWASAWRTRLYERNALHMLFSHLEPGNLCRVLPAALLLVAQRILLGTPFADERTPFRRLLARLGGAPFPDADRMEEPARRASSDGRTEPLSADAAARLSAVSDWLSSLAVQRRRREQLQRCRRRGDAEILSPFASRWTTPVGAEPRRLYRRLHDAVVEAFALDRITKRAPAGPRAELPRV